MKKLIVLSFILLSISGCGSNQEIENPPDKLNEPTQIDGISMTIKDETLTRKGATLIIEDTNGSGTYVYDGGFRIDKNENGNWVSLETIRDNCSFTLQPLYVDENGILEINENWECSYGELENGTYRLVKDTFLQSDIPVTNEDLKYFAVEFTIE